jgi:hypothetical protein
MSPALTVASILTVGWNLMLLVVARLTETGPFRPERTKTRAMARSRRTVQAPIGTEALDVCTEAWEREGGVSTTERVYSRLREASQEVRVEVPYAEASVTVTVEDEAERRRCSLCLN